MCFNMFDLSLICQVIERKNINVNFQHKLIEVIPDKKEAVFELTGDGNEGTTATFRVHTINSTYIIEKESIECPINTVSQSNVTLGNVM